MRESLRRWHVWLGWVAGVPLLLWSISGLIMASRPLAEIRSEIHLREPTVASGAYRAPPLARPDIRAMALLTGPAGPRWRLTFADGRATAFDAVSAAPLPRLTAAQAAAVATAGYRKVSPVASVTFVDRNRRSHEFPRAVDAWRVKFDDGMRIYVDAWGGEVLVARSAWWSVYDKAWAIHIMDLQGREDPNNPWIVMLGLMTVILTVGSLALLPRATRRLFRSSGEAEER